MHQIFLVPHSHIDIEWYWTFEETKKRALMITESVLNCMKKNENFTFAQDQVILLKIVWEYLSKRDKKFLLQKIKENKLEIVGGMWVQPDVQIPHGEVLIRNILKGRQWLYDNFGINVEIAWNIDTFGQCPQLPQILKKSGYKYFVFTRGVPKEIAKELPNVFYWQSPDGSKILTYWMDKGYGPPLLGILPQSRALMNKLFYEYKTLSSKKNQQKEFIDKNSIKKIKKWLNGLLEKSPQDMALVPLGGDNFIPEDDIFKVIDVLNKELKDYNLFFSTPSKFFQEFKNKNLKTFTYDLSLPLRVGDLRGTFEGRCELKKAQRKRENLLLSAEKFSYVATSLGLSYPESKLKLTWDDVIFNSFHDIMGGSHTDDVYREAMRKYGMIKETGKINEVPELILKDSLSFIVSKIKVKEEAKVIFNSLSWERNDICETEVNEDAEIRDENGKIIPSQREGIKLFFIAKDIPSLGYKTYYISKISKNSRNYNKLTSKENRLENKWWIIEFDSFCGGIKRIYDKEKEREILDTSHWVGNELIAQSHDGDLEGMLNLKEEVWRTKDYEISQSEIINGSVFSEAKFKGEFKNSQREQSIKIYKELKRIDFETKIDLRESELFIRVRFPLNLKNPRIFYETPYLVVERPEGHFAAQNWVSCQEKDYGITLINTGNPGYWIEDKNLDLVLLWSVNQVRPPKSYNASLAKEIGKHAFKYSLCPYSGSWQENKIVRKGIEVNNPLLVTNKRRSNEEILPFKKSFLKVEPLNFIITTLKLAEDKENWIIRGYETEGRESKVSLVFGFPIKRAWLSDLKEKREKELKIKGNKISFKVKKFEIVTILLEGGKR